MNDGQWESEPTKRDVNQKAAHKMWLMYGKTCRTYPKTFVPPRAEFDTFLTEHGYMKDGKLVMDMASGETFDHGGADN